MIIKSKNNNSDLNIHDIKSKKQLNIARNLQEEDKKDDNENVRNEFLEIAKEMQVEIDFLREDNEEKNKEIGGYFDFFIYLNYFQRFKQKKP